MMVKIMRVNLLELKFNLEDMPKKYQGLRGRDLTSQYHIKGGAE